MENKKKSYKWCFVPKCTNTTINAPGKTFVTVPRTQKTRMLWYQAARRDSSTIASSDLYCCEDHFNLKEDMENYMFHKLMNVKIRLKAGILPHLFDCQIDGKRAANSTSRSAVGKRLRKELVAEARAEVNISTNTPSSRKNIASSAVEVYCDQELNFEPQIIKSSKTEFADCNFKLETSTAACSSKNINIDSRDVVLHENGDNALASTSSFVRTPLFGELFSSEISSSRADCDSDIDPTDDCVSSNSEKSSSEPTKCIINLNSIAKLCQEKSKPYLGIPQEFFWIINLLCEKSNNKLYPNYVLLTLMKIKLNDSFGRLADQFQMSATNCSRIFSKTVPVLAHLLKAFIYWPNEEVIKKSLPVPFRTKYSHVQSIIDCLEIEIEKPADPLKQTLTYSEYRKCNTFKYLVSATPDGFINFISSGFGGRISDIMLLRESGFLNNLPEGCGIMADRGFKHGAKIFQDTKSELIKPASVSVSVKSSKEQVWESKYIASLHIHMERVTGRLREFEYLKPHSVINHKMLAYTDDVIIIACALINLQMPIIKSCL